MELSLKDKLKIYVLALICSFVLGSICGYRIVENEAKTYMGTIIKKDYTPSQIKYEKIVELVNGKYKETKKPEVSTEQYSFLVKDVFGERIRTFVTKEEYKQFEVGDKYRR